ncbi:MAG: DUF262 domain-containing protein [Dehalococcoidia bacterium]
MKLYQPLDLNLRDAVRLIDGGELQLPEFQRNFRWGVKPRLELLDSIQKGFPVGTLLLMEMSPGIPSPFGARTFEGAPESEPAKARYLVLDGQQRLSTCYWALRGDPRRVLAINLRELFSVTEGDAGRPINLADFLVTRNRPDFLEKLLYGSHLLPVTFLTDSQQLTEFLSSYRKQLAQSPATAEFADFVDTKLRSYIEVFFTYEFPCVVLPAGLDLEAVCNIFTKINTTGQKLSAFDLCVATLFPQGENLRERLQKAHDHPGVSTLDRDGTTILQTVALLARKEPQTAALPKNISKDDVTKYWDRAVRGVGEAADMLLGAGFWDFYSVPYDALIPPLAASIAAIGDRPRSQTERESLLRKTGRWVYQTAIEQRYNEGTDVKQARDFVTGSTWFATHDDEVPEFARGPMVWTPSATLGARTGARARALTAALNEHGPRDLMTQTVLGYGSGRQTPEIHHIFPRAFLRDAQKRHGSESERALNMTFLTKETNSFISDRAPSVYLTALMDRISTSDSVDIAEARRRLEAILITHFIDGEALDALLSDDYEAFLSARSNVFRRRLADRFGVYTILAPVEDEADVNVDAEDDGSIDVTDP